MKKLSWILALLTIPALWGAENKIVSVDMEKVFQEYYKTARSEAALKQQETLYEDHAKRLSAEIEKVREQRDDLKEKSLNVALTEKARDDARRDAEELDRRFQEKRQELREFMESKQQELRKRYLQERKQLVEELSLFIKDYAQREQIDFVFDSSGLTSNLIPVLIYAAPSADITDALLLELNKGHEQELKAAREKLNDGNQE